MIFFLNKKKKEGWVRLWSKQIPKLTSSKFWNHLFQCLKAKVAAFQFWTSFCLKVVGNTWIPLSLPSFFFFIILKNEKNNKIIYQLFILFIKKIITTLTLFSCPRIIILLIDYTVIIVDNEVRFWFDRVFSFLEYFWNNIIPCYFAT